MAQRQTPAPITDWQDVDPGDWEDVTPSPRPQDAPAVSADRQPFGPTVTKAAKFVEEKAPMLGPAGFLLSRLAKPQNLAAAKEGFVSATAPLHSPIKTAESVVTALNDPVNALTPLGTARALVGLGRQAYEKPEETAFGLAGTAAGGLLTAKLGGQIGKTVKEGTQAAATKFGVPENLMQRSAQNHLGALRPTTLEHKAVAQRISPELAKRGVGSGLTGKAYDADIMARLAKASDDLQVQEARVVTSPESYKVPRKILQDEIGSAIEKLKVRGTNVTGHPEAVAALREEFNRLKGMPEFIEPDQLIAYNRQLDKAVQDAGGFRVTGKDAIRVQVKRGVSNIIRAAKNSLDPQLSAANKEYSLYRNAADIVERRELGGVGATGWQLPGRGTLLDDILATWAGHAVGGPAGAAAVEGANLIRQSRGYANVKAKALSGASKALTPAAGPKISDFFRKP